MAGTPYKRFTRTIIAAAPIQVNGEIERMCDAVYEETPGSVLVSISMTSLAMGCVLIVGIFGQLRWEFPD